MIYSCTFNPSIDFKIELNKMEINKLNRYSDELFQPGGKGINCSSMLSILGTKSIALGFSGGFTGEWLTNSLKNKIKTEFINITGNTRINFKIKSGEETTFNGSGPLISDSTFSKLEKKVGKIKPGDVMIISGSKPNGQDNAYEKIIKIIKNNKALLVVDTNNESLLISLKYKPFLIKPNKTEAEEVLRMKIKNSKDAVKALYKLQKKGAQNVLLSLGKEGAMLLTSEKEIYYGKAPKGKFKNTVGSGDSMLAGFIHGFIKTNDPEKSLQLAIASGSASSFSDGLASKSEINKLVKEIKIERIM